MTHGSWDRESRDLGPSHERGPEGGGGLNAGRHMAAKAEVTET